MFYSLTGKLVHMEPGVVAIECGGVAFKCFTSMNTQKNMPRIGETATVYTHLNVREDALDLYGFSTKSELNCYKMLTKVNEPPKRIKFSGGILHSPAWAQMCADIFQKDLEVDDNEQGSLLGGAVLAMELAGVIGDVRDFDPAPAKIIHPNPEMADFYEKKFERYLKCYEAGC